MLKVVTSTLIRTIEVGGRQLALGFAKETDRWKRIHLAPEVQERFVLAMAKADVPDNAATAIMA